MEGKQSVRHCNARFQNIQQHTEKAMTRQRKRRKNIDHGFSKVQMGNCVKNKEIC